MPHALRAGVRRLIHVDSIHRRAFRTRAREPDRVVEYQDAFCARHLFQKEGLDFGVVDRFDIGFGVEGLPGRGAGDVLDGGEGVGGEVEGGWVVVTEIGDCNVFGGVAEVALGEALGGLLDVVEWEGVVGGGLVEVEGRGDGAAGDVEMGFEG